MTIELNNKVIIPSVGFGTVPLLYDNAIQYSSNKFVRKFQSLVYLRYKIYQESKIFSENLSFALSVGYRLIDTSSAYHNAQLIGDVIKKSGLKREELFITARISNTQQYNNEVKLSLEKSLKEFGVDYVDLFMFHWPVPEHFIQTWKTMEQLYNEGKARSLGVANCHEHHLEELLKHATIAPAINQIEVHPLLSQKPLIEYCKSKGIVVEAYTPLGRNHELIHNNEVIKEIASSHNKTIAQIVLRWHVQNGLVPIPRSSNHARLKQNINIFDFILSPQQMKDIDNVNINLRLRYDPDNCDFKKL